MMERISRGQLQDILIAFDKEAFKANEEGRIFEFLRLHQIPYDEEDEFPYDKKRVRILIAGQASLNPNDVNKVLSQQGIDPNRVDAILEYESLQKYKWGALQYSEKYCDVIVGPMGHSAVGKGDYSSIIARMQSEDGWPNCVRAEANGELKITKSSLAQALQQTVFFKNIVRRGF